MGLPVRPSHLRASGSAPGRSAAGCGLALTTSARSKPSARPSTVGAEKTDGVLIQGEAWVRVTFAEKPERAVLDALRTVGFRWGGRSWVGGREKLPGGDRAVTSVVFGNPARAHDPTPAAGERGR